MIVVLADDLSGAAELANEAVCRGLSAEVQLAEPTKSNADVVCVSLETRLLPPADAKRIATATAKIVATWQPTDIFLKCDSVLRGHPLVESHAVAAVFQRSRILLVPANPSRKRVIRGGQYFIDGVPLDETTFARDPEWPRHSSRVANLLSGVAENVSVPDVCSNADIEAAVNGADDSMLLVGGVDCFVEFLTSKLNVKNLSVNGTKAAQADAPIVFICGSLAAWTTHWQRDGSQPELLIIQFAVTDQAEKSSPDFDLWSAAAALLRRGTSIVIAIGDQKLSSLSTSQLTQRFGEFVAEFVRQARPKTIAIEGGATVAAVLRELGFQRLQVPIASPAGMAALVPIGVAAAPLIFAKPGSYRWPNWMTSPPSNTASES